jgi:hypothetical protein
LADVFEQAVFPTVLSLPSLTPEAESLALLNAAYPALFDMAGLDSAFLIPPSSSSVDDLMKVENATAAAEDSQSNRSENRNRGFTEPQRKLIDKIVREGIMVGYHHAKEHIRLVDFLCRALCSLVSGIGILSVKYLKVSYSSIYITPVCLRTRLFRSSNATQEAESPYYLSLIEHSKYLRLM